MSAKLRRLFLLVAIISVPGCVDTRPPAMSSLTAFGMEARFREARTPADIATVELLDRRTREPLATSPSLFNHEVVRAGILPDQERGTVFVSASGKTVIVHENASESAPNEQIIVFSRMPGEETHAWVAWRCFPPSKRAMPYAISARTVGIDDGHLYFAYSDRTVRKIPLHQLELVPARSW